MEPLPTKKCSKCHEEKTLDLFPIGGTACKDGRIAKCRVCFNAKAREKAKKLRESTPVKVKPKGPTRAEKWKNDPEWRERNYGHIKRYRQTSAGKAKRREYDRKRRQNPVEALKEAFYTRIRTVIKGHVKSARTMILLGCSYDQLISHIESLFQPGMTWENHGKYHTNGPMTWHIDHILPCAAFDLSKEEEQRKCFHWSNLQPLWAKDNMIKGDWVPNYQI